ncbi:MAG: dTDP-4-dehydrorhamnose 3,5-epimerase [Collinsella sp.]
MADIAFEKDLSVTETGIEGLKVVDLAVHGDSRGWFKENWQRAKMTALGIPDLRVVQNNISYNEKRGVTRGIHAEPWDKFISVARGSVFGAWVDLREGSATYGKVFTCTLDPSRAIYVPRGVGNSFQALEDGTAYTYLVDAHWSLELKKTYTFVNLADPELGIEWPIPLQDAVVSEADLNHPFLKDVIPMAPKRTLVIGSETEVGNAIKSIVGHQSSMGSYVFFDGATFDISDPRTYQSIDGSLYGAIINCSAGDGDGVMASAEFESGNWTAEDMGSVLLARFCAEYGIDLVCISSLTTSRIDCECGSSVLDNGLLEFGLSEMMNEVAAQNCPNHYIVRKDCPLSSMTDNRSIAKTILDLLENKLPYGTYSMQGRLLGA